MNKDWEKHKLGNFMLLYEYLDSCKGITCIKKEALKAAFKDIRSYHRKSKKPEN